MTEITPGCAICESRKT